MIATVLMPDLAQPQGGPILVEKWLQTEGARVRQGQPLLLAAVDKACVEVRSSASGFLRKRLVAENEAARAGTPLAWVGPLKDPLPSRLPAKSVLARRSTALPAAPVPLPREGLPRISPRARRAAQRLNLPLEALPLPSGQQRITEKDVLAAAETLHASPTGASHATLRLPAERRPLHPLRLQQAESAAYSQAYVPQLSLDMLCRADPLLTMLQKLRSQHGPRQAPALEDFCLKALALALADNAFKSFRGVIDGTEVIYRGEINLGFAVWLDPEGMLIPVLRRVDQMSIDQLAKASRELTGRAAKGKLSSLECSGGLLSLISLAKFDVACFRPLIRPGEAAVLALPQAQMRPMGKAAQIAAAWSLTLAVDQRLIEPALAARFLQKIVELLECPDRLL